MVGRLSRIRVSSVIAISPCRSSVGTLKSTRTSTRCPLTSRSRRVSLFMLSLMLMILIVLLILGVTVETVFLTKHISPLGKPLQQPDHHSNNCRQFALGSCNLLFSRKLSRHQNVQTCRALERRAARHLEKPRAILDRKLSVTLSDVKRNACRSTVELILGGSLLCDLWKELADPRAKRDGLAVNVRSEERRVG